MDTYETFYYRVTNHIIKDSCAPPVAPAAILINIYWVNATDAYPGPYFFMHLQMPLQAIGEPPLKIATPEVMEHIKQVINEMDIPSRVNSVSHNYRDAKAGMVKADKWHNLSNFFFLLHSSACGAKEHHMVLLKSPLSSAVSLITQYSWFLAFVTGIPQVQIS